MKAAIRLMILNKDIFMGPGTKVLLERIVELRSIKEAAKSMEMSYVKALGILRTMESALGFAVVVSEKGGITRGGTRLTPAGERVLKAYQEIEQDVFRYAQELIDQKFIFDGQP